MTQATKSPFHAFSNEQKQRYRRYLPLLLLVGVDYSDYNLKNNIPAVNLWL